VKDHGDHQVNQPRIKPCVLKISMILLVFLGKLMFFGPLAGILEHAPIKTHEKRVHVK